MPKLSRLLALPLLLSAGGAPFDEAGSLREEAIYDERGVLKNKRSYDEHGKLTADEEYFEDGSRKLKPL